MLRFSYYSWRLPTLRRLGAAEELWQELVIVLGHFLVICEGFLCLPRRSAKDNSSKLLVSLSYLTCGSVLAVSNVWTRFVLHLLAAEPPSVGRHNGDVACQQAREPREKIDCLLPLDFSWYSYCVDKLIGSSPLHGGINLSILSLLCAN